MKKVTMVMTLYLGAMAMMLWGDRVEIENHTDMMVHVGSECNDCGLKVSQCDRGVYDHVKHERHCDECGRVQCKHAPLMVSLKDRCGKMQKCVELKLDGCRVEPMMVELDGKQYRISAERLQSARFLFWGGNNYYNVIVEQIN